MSDKPEVPAAEELLADSRAFWRDLGRQMVKNSLKSVEDTARQIVVIAGVLEGIYFHAIAFAELPARVTTTGIWLFSAPVLLLLLSLMGALLVFWPASERTNINSSLASKQFYEQTLRHKRWMLRSASLFLCLGVLALFAAVVVYLSA